MIMGKSVLNDKRVLLVSNQPAVLMVLEEKILRVAPNCYVDKAIDYENTVHLFVSYTYDLVILDSLSFRSSDFLNLTVNHFPPPPVVLLTSLYLNLEVLKGFLKMGARIFPSKENFPEIIPFLEGVVRHENSPKWRRLLEDSIGLFRGTIKRGWQKGSRFELKRVGGTESIS